MRYQNFIEQNKLNLKLKPIYIGQLLVTESLNDTAFSYENGLFTPIIGPSEPIDNDFIIQYGSTHSNLIFVSHDDYDFLTHNIAEELLKATRSLSIGDPLKNSMKQSHLLSLQMSNLYDDPFNDELLNSQFRSSNNLGSFLLSNKNIHKSLYNNITKQGHHYIVAQPLLSSILLLSFLQHLGTFNEKEIQTLFNVSYFRDIGMSLIPKEKYDLTNLSSEETQNLSNHSKYSIDILKNRLSFGVNYLNLIENHHFLNPLNRSSADLIVGVESILFSVADIIVAMISKRPYRDEKSLFEALGLVKDLISEEYPQEYKALVIYLKKFYS